jgi:ribosomal protein S18 acetylase RimI-like enzyme
MLHAFEMPETDGAEEDFILRPYSELEDPGSLYISGIAVDADRRGQGIGNALLDVAEGIASKRGVIAYR